nr:reverse transcriptase domain-containing protein [Tanacetum cinerariifolium]
MRTRSRSRHKFVEPLRIEFPSLEDQFQEDPPEVPMADNRTMAQFLQAPTEGYEDAIVILEITATNFELKHGLINLLQNKQFFGHAKEDPHAHICYFNKITFTMRVPNVPNSMIKLMLFPFSLEGAARIWLEKEPPRYILTWDDLVSKFINQSKVCVFRHIPRFQQRFDESFSEAWDRFNDLLRACPHHGFSELHQLDTFYNALNVNDQDSLNSAAGGNFLDKMPSDCLKIIKSKSKDLVRALLLDKKNQSSAPAPSHTPTPVKAVKPNCVTCGGSGTLPGNTITNLKEDLKAPVQPPVAQSEIPIFEPIVAPISAPMPNLKPSIPYPSRPDNERRHDQANEQIEKFYEIFKDMSLEISFTDALILMPKFASTLKALIGNKEKLSEMDRTLMNEHCSAVILNKLPKKLGDPNKFLIPCEFLGMDECLALADLDRSVSKPISIAKDVLVKIDRALIDVHKGELTLCIENESITYNLDQTLRYSANYDQMTANKIDVTDMAYEEYSQEVLGFFDVTASGNLTPSNDPIVSTTSPTLTPFGDSDFLLFEDADAFLGLEDDPDSPKVNPSYYDLEGDILLLKAIMNSEPVPPLPNHEQSMPSFNNELKACEANTIKSFVDEPPEVELKDLPPHLEYAFLESDNKLPTMEVFMDDFSIFGNSFKNCLSRLDKMLQRCENTKLCLNWEKSHFMVKDGIVLGHKIFKNGIEVDKAKVDIITKLPHPTTVKGVRSFLGHTGFYRRFIKDFSKISRPMTHLLEKNTPFIFFEDCIKAFQTLKKKLTEAPILIAPNWDLPFELMCDASDFAIEMLAVVYAFEKFRLYLIMNKCIVHTDHSALKYLFAKKDAKARLLGWVLLLQEFDFEVLDTKGAEKPR